MLLGKGAKRPVLITAFGDHLPGVATVLPIVIRTFPNYIVRENGLDFDPACLLLTGSAIMDQAAFAHVTEPTRAYLRPMASTLRRLAGDETVLRVSFDDEAKAFRSTMSRWVATELEEPQRWRGAILEQWKLHRPQMEDQLAVIGKSAIRKYEEMPFGVVAYLRNGADMIRDSAAESLMRLVRTKRHRLTSAEREDLQGVARPYVSQVIFDHLLACKLGATIVPWPGLAPFRERILNPEIVQKTAEYVTRQDVEECMRLFREIVRPELRIVDPDELMEFLADTSATRSLRSAIRKVTSSEGHVSAAMLNEILTELTSSLQCAQRRERKLKLATLFLKLAMSASGCAVFSEALVAASEWVREAADYVVEALGFGAEELVERKTTSKYEWYLKLNELRMRRKNPK